MPGGVGIWWGDISPDKTPAENTREMRDVRIARMIGMHLEAKYPDHHFKIAVDSEQGVAMVTIPVLLPETMKYVIKLADLYGDTTLRCVTKAGGELLERFNIRRGRRNPERFSETIAANRHVRHARAGYLNMVDLSTGRTKRVVPDALAR